MCTIDDVAKNLERGRESDVIILDFSKAFDCVNHRKLLHKLNSYGINKQILIWLKSFLERRTQVVVVENSESEIIQVTSGVPQGSVLEPLLFHLYINDLPESVKSQCRLFADDALLYNDVTNRIIVQDDLNRLQCWADNWQMVFNPKKCYHLTIGKNVNFRNTFYLCGEKLEVVKSNPYLGIDPVQSQTGQSHQ